MADDAQRQDYSKGARSGRDVAEHSLEMTKGGASGGGNTGPTGSPRDYAKSGKTGKEPAMKNWNPMKMPPSTYGIDGCGGC